MIEHKITVWWIPQIPMQAFEVEVPDLDTAVLLCNTLAQYDLFQYNNKVKPDYSNAGGIQLWHAEMDEDEEPEHFDFEDEDDLECLREILERLNR